MVSFLFLLLLSIVLICCLIIKLIRIRLSRQANSVSCIVLPILAIIVFLSMLCECYMRRKSDIKQLDEMTSIVSQIIGYNRVFSSNGEKEACIDSLKYLQGKLEGIVIQDSLISIIYGESQDMKNRITMTSNLVASQRKRLERLNDYLPDTVIVNQRIRTNNIHVHNPFSTKLRTQNVIFSCHNNADSIIAVQVTIYRKKTISYQKQYEYKRVNSISIPNAPNTKETIEVGFITKKDSENILNYCIYEK